MSKIERLEKDRQSEAMYKHALSLVIDIGGFDGIDSEKLIKKEFPGLIDAVVSGIEDGVTAYDRHIN